MKITKQNLLTVGAIFGLGATIAATIVATPKAKELADKYKDNKIEAAKRVAPLYIPTLFSACATVGCIVAKDYVSKKELLALTASTTATTSYLVANRDKLKKVLENSRVKNLKESLMPTKEEFKHQTIETTGNGDLLCIDGYSGRIFRSSQDAVIDAEEKLNEMYIDPECGYCCLNDWYRFLGIEESQFGWDHGWVNAREEYYPNEPIEFSNELVSEDAPGNDYGEPIFCIDIQEYWHPMEGWMEL